MTLGSEQHREILAVFREEVREIGERMTRDLLALESARAEESPPLYVRLLRDLHTLKGNAKSLDVAEVALVAHAAESVLRRCEKGERRFDSGMTSALLSFLDQTAQRLQTLSQGEVVSGPEGLAELHDRFEQWAGVTSDAPGPTPPRSDLAAPAEAGSAPPRGDSFLRVSLTQLEGLSRAVDELVVARLRAGQRAVEAARVSARLDGATRRGRLSTSDQTKVAVEAVDLEELARNLAVDFQSMGALTEDLQEALKTLQLVPAAQLLEPFRRSVRDQSLAQGKEVVLDLQGGEVVADRRVLESLRGPLNHLFLNAIDHGLESPERRRRLGKDSVSTIRLSVSAEGAHLCLTVVDDGAGVDAARIREVAVERGIWTAEEAVVKSEEETLALVWYPGFTTAQTVTETSGRGVGLDAVREAVSRLAGRVELRSVPGRGTTVKLEVPLTLTQSMGLLVEVGGNNYLLPLSSVEAVARYRVGDLKALGGALTLEHAKKHVPAVSLEAVLTGVPQQLPDPDARPLFCIVQEGGRLAALIVDRVFGEREMAVRSLGPELQGYEQFAGVSLTGDGRLVLVLSAGVILRRALEVGRATALQPRARRSLMVVDDAVSSRLLYRGVFEAAGYHVLLAGNGEEALDLIARQGTDAVICDVRMPRMDGLELTRRLRAQTGREELPVVLVSSLSSEDDRLEGLRVGATAYLVKGETTPQRIVDLLEGLLA
jgi:two-component system, chemotaxis family, sensor kinase CheA